MIRFRTLGSLDLRDDSASGRDFRGVLGQPKRLALLAYLALARPQGFHRRDTLLALFWPELDADQARHALRQALYVLRRELGANVLATRGEDEVRVDSAHLWCDAAAFEEALNAGNAAGALELYHGDLLPGFFAAGTAPEFDEWVERERAHLRELAARAAWELVTEEEEHNPALAAHWARRAVALALDDEKALRKLIALCDRLGDRAGAVRAYEEFAARLLREFDATPSAETKALISAVRAREKVSGSPSGLAPGATARGAEPRQPSSQSEADSGSAAAGNSPPRAGPAPGQSFRARKQRRVAGAVVLVIAAGAAALAWSTRRERPMHAAARSGLPRVVVFPFVVRGDRHYDYLGEGVVGLLSANLEGAGDLRAVDPRVVLAAVPAESARALSPVRARELARRFGASRFILGDVVAAGPRLSVTASVYEPERVDAPTAMVKVERSASEIPSLVDDLTARIIATRMAGPGARLSRVAALTTRSVPALKAYLEGEGHLRAGSYGPAAEAFQRAVAEDSLFALAHYRLSVAAVWAGLDTLAAGSAERATRLGDRLSERDRRLLRAHNALRHGRAREAEELHNSLLINYGDDLEVLLNFGELLFHYGPPQGRSVAEARPAFERVLSMEPTHLGALWHLIRIAASERKAAEVDSLVRRALSVAGGDRTLDMRAIRAVMLRDHREVDRIVAELRVAGGAAGWGTAWWTAVYTGDLNTAQKFASTMTSPSRPREVRASGHTMLAYLDLARGRWTDAKRQAAAVEAFDYARALETQAVTVFAIPELPVRREDFQSVLSSLVHWRPPPPIEGWRPSAQDWHGGIRLPLREYLVGAISARLGDTARAARAAAGLSRLGGPPEVAALARDLSWGVRARAHIAARRSAEALSALEAMQLEARDELFTRSLFFSRAPERYLRAMLLAEAGRSVEALRWYASFGEGSLFDLIYLAPSHARRAEIYEQLGDWAKAAEHYEHFVELWNNCDRELRRRVEGARERLAQLRARAGS